MTMTMTAASNAQRTHTPVAPRYTNLDALLHCRNDGVVGTRLAEPICLLHGLVQAGEEDLVALVGTEHPCAFDALVMPLATGVC